MHAMLVDGEGGMRPCISASTTSLFYRDLGARWLTTRSKMGIRRSNKNRLTFSKTPIYGWWRPAWILSFEGRVGNVAWC